MSIGTSPKVKPRREKKMNKQMTPAEIELVQQSFARLAPISDRVVLQPAKTQTTIETRVFNFSTTWLGSALRGFKPVYRTIRSRLTLGSDDVALGYNGRSWCDSTERELIHDVANCPFRRSSGQL
jgi:hypothetical protein